MTTRLLVLLSMLIAALCGAAVFMMEDGRLSAVGSMVAGGGSVLAVLWFSAGLRYQSRQLEEQRKQFSAQFQHLEHASRREALLFAKEILEKAERDAIAQAGGADGSISRARLLAHCSAAVRPRADVEARAYNLVLALHGQAQADDLMALLEDREGARAIMRATLGDPEDVNEKRLPFILERVLRDAGEYAAALVRGEAQRQLEQARASHDQELDRIRSEADAAQVEAAGKARDAQAALVQREQGQCRLQAHADALRVALEGQLAQDRKRKARILEDGYAAGRSRYKVCRLAATVLFGLAGGYVSLLSASSPWTAAAGTVVLGVLGFWFVPDLLDLPFSALARARMRKVVLNRDPSLAMPDSHPDFKRGGWSGAMFLAASEPANSGAAAL